MLGALFYRKSLIANFTAVSIIALCGCRGEQTQSTRSAGDSELNASSKKTSTAVTKAGYKDLEDKEYKVYLNASENGRIQGALSAEPVDSSLSLATASDFDAQITAEEIDLGTGSNYTKYGYFKFASAAQFPLDGATKKLRIAATKSDRAASTSNFFATSSSSAVPTFEGEGTSVGRGIFELSVVTPSSLRLLDDVDVGSVAMNDPFTVYLFTNGKATIASRTNPSAALRPQLKLTYALAGHRLFVPGDGAYEYRNGWKANQSAIELINADTKGEIFFFALKKPDCVAPNTLFYSLTLKALNSVNANIVINVSTISLREKGLPSHDQLWPPSSNPTQLFSSTDSGDLVFTRNETVEIPLANFPVFNSDNKLDATIMITNLGTDLVSFSGDKASIKLDARCISSGS